MSMAAIPSMSMNTGVVSFILRDTVSFSHEVSNKMTYFAICLQDIFDFLAEESMSIEASISMNTEVVSVLYCETQLIICRVTHLIRRILQFNYRIYLAF